MKIIKQLQYKVKNKYEFNKEDDFLETILTQAGIEDTRKFLNLTESCTHDPFLLRNIEEGIILFHSNIGKNKHVFIKVDSDVDGLTSAAYIRQFIMQIAPETKISYKISFEKEHGIYYKDVKEYTDLDLIIVPDAGSDCIEQCKEIKEKTGVPILILDHHDILNRNIYYYATVVNCCDEQYPNDTLSGVGVVHKFCFAYSGRHNLEKWRTSQFLDLVALGQIADSMDMRNYETRYYTLEGLKEENQKNLFIKEFAEYYKDEMKLGHTITSYGWVVAPKLNATMRFGKPQEQTDLFRAICGEQENIEYQPKRKDKDDDKPDIEIHSLQKTMARVCGNIKARQDTKVRKLLSDIKSEISNKKLDKNSVIIVDGTKVLTEKTITGLVANKLTAYYNRPVLILKDYKDGILGGSGRGYENGQIENFKQFLLDSEFFQKCAGHEAAFGVYLKKDNIDRVIQYCNSKVDPATISTIYEVDYAVQANNLTLKAVKSVADSYKIWGNHLNEPSFLVKDLIIKASDIEAFGENKGFIKFTYGSIDYIKKYCKKTDFEELTLHDRKILGKNKKTLKLTLICNFILTEYDGQLYPQVKINQFYSEEYNPIESDSKNKNSKLTIEDDFLF